MYYAVGFSSSAEHKLNSILHVQNKQLVKLKSIEAFFFLMCDSKSQKCPAALLG